MEEKKINRPHSIKIDNRSGGTVTGVKKLVSAAPNAITLDTVVGGLTVTGAGLKLGRYDEQDGTLAFSGTVNTVKYEAAKTPLLKRIFK